MVLIPLSIGANISYRQSEVPINPVEAERTGLEEGATRQFQGQSPYIVNTIVSWALRGGNFDATVAFNYFGDRLTFNGAEGTPDVFERGRGDLNLMLSQAFGLFKLRVEVAKILNPSYETFASFKDRDFGFTSFKTGQTFKVSLGYTLR